MVAIPLCLSVYLLRERTTANFCSNLRYSRANRFYQNPNTDQHHFWILSLHVGCLSICCLAFTWTLTLVTQRFCFSQFKYTAPVFQRHVKKLLPQHYLSWKVLVVRITFWNRKWMYTVWLTKPGNGFWIVLNLLSCLIFPRFSFRL